MKSISNTDVKRRGRHVSRKLLKYLIELSNNVDNEENLVALLFKNKRALLRVGLSVI
jgi:hypothetical protein